jgi:hypothetical protein
MAINRLIPFGASLALTGTVGYALMVDVPQSAPHHSQSPQNCLISTKSCVNVSKVLPSPCLVASKPCLQSGELIAVAPGPPRK